MCNWLGMYLRMTKRRNTDGSEVRYYQLAENEWNADKGCAVAKVVYSFGRVDDKQAEKLRRLARSIQRVLTDETASVGTVAPVGGGEIRILDSWPLGGIHVLSELWKEFEVGKVLAACMRREKTDQPFDDAVFAMVANRALSPYSKLYCFEQWLREEVFLPSAEPLALHHLYLGMDFLERNKAEIEKAVYFKTADLMKADVDLLFYDTTSLHFEVDEEDEISLTKEGRTYAPQRKRGYSKNGRGDAPQIVVGLAVTRDGLPVRSWVFPGQTADITTVEKVKEDLRGWKLGRCIFVGDAGMNSDDNRRKLALGNGKYILAAKMRAGDDVTNLVLTRAGRFKEVAGNLRVKEVIVGDGERRQRYVVCHNPTEETRQRDHRNKVIAQLEVELATLKQDDSKHSKRACALLVSSRFGRFLTEGADGKVRIDRAAVKDAERYDGKWVITSNDDTLTPEDLALGYKQLLCVEECWRTLKSGLRMRPAYHWRPWRIHAHVTISVLALLLERIVEIRTGDTWRNVSKRLETIKVVEYEHGEARIKQTSEIRPEVLALLRKLNVPVPARIHSVVEIPVGAADDNVTDGETPPVAPPA
jgi:transposase